MKWNSQVQGPQLILALRTFCLEASTLPEEFSQEPLQVGGEEASSSRPIVTAANRLESALGSLCDGGSVNLGTAFPSSERVGLCAGLTLKALQGLTLGLLFFSVLFLSASEETEWIASGGLGKELGTVGPHPVHWNHLGL